MIKPQKTRVLIVDDSAVVRQTMASLINSATDLEVIGTAADPFQAADLIRRVVPDVITLDVEMPRMDGITFLRRLMTQHPLPVIVCSSLVGAGTRTLLDAMEAGAVDVIQKPAIGTKRFFEESTIRIQDAVRAAARARLRPSHASSGRRRSATPQRSANVAAMSKTTQKVVAIGASTGGTEALRTVLEALPPYAPGIVIVQHMPAGFTRAFAERLDQTTAISVREAENGASVLRGQALIAPGNRHMELSRSGANYRVALSDGPLVSRHRPSVDVLFQSVARVAGANATGIIMTGMGNDGTSGLLEMRNAGAHTIGQDEASCIVYGMPKEALKAGAVTEQASLETISDLIVLHGQEAV